MEESGFGFLQVKDDNNGFSKMQNRNGLLRKIKFVKKHARLLLSRRKGMSVLKVRFWKVKFFICSNI